MDWNRDFQFWLGWEWMDLVVKGLSKEKRWIKGRWVYGESWFREKGFEYRLRDFE